MNIFECLIQKNYQEFLSLLDYESIELKDENGSSLLHVAVASDDLFACETLVDYGIDLNLRDNDGNTPLHLAAIVDNVDIYQLLLDYGCNTNLKNKSGKSPAQLSGKNIIKFTSYNIEGDGGREKMTHHRNWDE